MSSVNSVSSLSFIAGGGNSDMSVTSKIEAIQQKIKETLDDIKEIAESDMDEKTKKELLEMKQRMVQVYQSQITMIQNQAMQEARQEAAKEAQQMVKDQLGATGELATQRAAESQMKAESPSAISHIGEKEDGVDSDKQAADGSEVASKKEDDQKDPNKSDEPELRGPRRPISEYI